jgi:hypothetical protein
MYSSNFLNHRGWIYICVDPKDISICKIGMTRRELYSRVTETTNPHYVVFAAYKVPEDEALAIERYVHRDLERFSIERQSHRMTGRNSEWFAINSAEAIKLLDWTLSHCLEDASWCSETDRPSNYENIRYIPNEFLPADYHVLQRIHQSYLNEIESRDRIDVERWLYRD